MAQTSPNEKTEPALLLEPKNKKSQDSFLWECATNSFILTIPILITGQLALGFIGGFWESLGPTLPPGLTGLSGLSPSQSLWKEISRWFSQHSFWIIYGLVFCVGAAQHAGIRLPALSSLRSPRVQEAARRFAADWFTILVNNLFVALAGAVSVFMVTQLTVNALLIQWVTGTVSGTMVSWAGDSWWGSLLAFLGRCLDWYSDNSFRFNFWLIYLGSILDDLGLPNLKTWVRWGWRKIRKQKKGAPSKNPFSGPAPG